MGSPTALASIVCYSAVRMRRMTQYTASGMRLRQLLCLPTFFCSGASSKTIINCFMPRLPAASTKKKGFPLRKFFFFCSKSVYRLGHSCVSNVGSHSKRSRGELAHQRRVIGIFTSGENPAASTILAVLSAIGSSKYCCFAVFFISRSY